MDQEVEVTAVSFRPHVMLYLAGIVVENTRVDLVVADELRVVRFRWALLHAHAVSGGQKVNVVLILWWFGWGYWE